MISPKVLTQKSADLVNSVTPSVLVIARLAKVEAKDLAVALVSNEPNLEYMAKLQFEVAQAVVASAKKEDKKA